MTAREAWLTRKIAEGARDPRVPVTCHEPYRPGETAPGDSANTVTHVDQRPAASMTLRRAIEDEIAHGMILVTPPEKTAARILRILGR